MAPSKKTKFNNLWLDPAMCPEFADWVRPVKGNSNEAFCKICATTLGLGNMATGALKKHCRGVGHLKLQMLRKYQSSMADYCSKTTITDSDVATSNVYMTVMPLTSNASKPVETTCNALKPAETNASEKRTIQSLSSYIANEEVTRAEIVWALTIIEKKMSRSSCAGMSEIFKLMFPDSVIANNFQMGSDKVSYIINFGLAPYFQENLKDCLRECSDFTICFDESLNKIAQKGQMDLVVRFWNENESKVNSRYLNSVFLGRATAQDILDKFLEAMSDLPISKLLHISMDGPNVNLSFLKKLEDYISLQDPQPTAKKLVKFGTCGLHTIHNAVKAGFRYCDWEIVSLLRNLYYLFKDSPARRAEFTEVTGSALFPKKFCPIRWLENSECIERAVDIIDSVTIYLSSTKPKDSKVVIFLQNALKDQLLKCKLLFFKSLVLQCEKFLKKFQSPQPLAPYLHEDLSTLLSSVLKRFVKREKIPEGSAMIIKVDFESKENLLNVREVDIGFGTRKYIKQAKLSEKQKLEFFIACQKILKNVAKKVVEKSPLQYRFVLGLSSLDPNVILNAPSLGSKRFKTVLEVLYNANRIEESVADKAKDQYDRFCLSAKERYAEEFSQFISKHSDEERLDSFFNKFLNNEKGFLQLWEVIKLCLILSHGNASVESGFSINKTMLVENLHEDSLVNQRRVFDSVKASGGTTKVLITKRMLLSVKAARQKYRTYLDIKKREKDKEASKMRQKRKLENEIKELEQKKKKLQVEKQKEETDIEQRMQALEKEKKSIHL